MSKKKTLSAAQIAPISDELKMNEILRRIERRIAVPDSHEALNFQELALRRTKRPELASLTSRQLAACGATIVVVHGAEAHGPHKKLGENRSRQLELTKKKTLSVRVAHANLN